MDEPAVIVSAEGSSPQPADPSLALPPLLDLSDIVPADLPRGELELLFRRVYAEYRGVYGALQHLIAGGPPETEAPSQPLHNTEDSFQCHTTSDLRGATPTLALRGSTSSVLQQHREQRQPYQLSFTVLVIEGAEATTVPLSTIVTKSYLRPDQREADTPVALRLRDKDKDQPLDGRVSAELFRLSSGGRDDASPDALIAREYSVGSTYSVGVDASPQERQGSIDVCNGPNRFNLTLDPGALEQGRLSRLETVGPDALLTNQTLEAFKNVYGGTERGGTMSPISSAASSVLGYITRRFVAANGFSHSSDEAEREGFARMLRRLCQEVDRQLRLEPRHPTVLSPCYVFGDIHGNFRDLHYFMTSLVQFGDLRYTPHRFLFLGDYVDRGEFSVEVVAFLFALKALSPHKVVLLRGNHEDTLVSGDMASYGSTSFRAQCIDLFGQVLGTEVWREASHTFASLPLTANIDGRIFCTHGGLPRYSGGPDDRLEILSRADFPRLESFFQIPEGETPEEAALRQAATDTCWSDPAEDEANLDAFGFGANPRGNGVYLFGSAAVDAFLQRYGFEYIFRAHQEKSDGLKLSKNARVFTIFSTSAYVGHSNGAGVVLVADGTIRLIIKNPPA